MQHRAFARLAPGVALAVDRKTHALHKSEHAGIAGQHVAMQPVQAFVGGALQQLAHQLPGHASAAPGVGHRDGELGLRAGAVHHVAGFAHQHLAAIHPQAGHQHLLTRRGGAGQHRQQPRRAAAHHGMKAHLLRWGRQVFHIARQPWLVVRRHRPHLRRRAQRVVVQLRLGQAVVGQQVGGVEHVATPLWRWSAVFAAARGPSFTGLKNT